MSMNIKEASHHHVAILSGHGMPLKPGFIKVVTNTKKSGLITCLPNGNLVLSEKAISSLPVVEPPKSNAEMHDCLCTLLSPKQKAMFQILSDGKEHNPETLAYSTEYNKGAKQFGFIKTYGKLSSLGLLKK
jgi:hypothetical protein